jgi:hypothetical protein
VSTIDWEKRYKYLKQQILEYFYCRLCRIENDDILFYNYFWVRKYELDELDYFEYFISLSRKKELQKVRNDILEYLRQAETDI